MILLSFVIYFLLTKEKDELREKEGQEFQDQQMQLKTLNKIQLEKPYKSNYCRRTIKLLYMSELVVFLK